MPNIIKKILKIRNFISLKKRLGGSFHGFFIGGGVRVLGVDCAIKVVVRLVAFPQLIY